MNARAFSICAALCATPASAELVSIRPVDAAGQPTAVRMEIIDAAGKSHIPDLALPVQLRCPSEPVANEAPGCATKFADTNFIENPHTGTKQFYVDGAFDIELVPGRYALAAYKGIEHSVTRVEVTVGPSPTAPVVVKMTRWSDFSRIGWVSADDHLHIGRASPADNAWLASWMQAEDLSVANLIQIGNQQAFDMTPQFAFGDASVYQAGGTMLLSGQEHPRTHVLGHTLILGADEPIDLRDTYSVYDNFFRLARKLGGVSGYAHWGLGAGENGLAVDAPHKQLSFVEVLQFEYPHYEVWYQLLNLGIPLAPTAGTDFPCGPWSVPGRERFYTRVDGELTRKSWLEGIRRGRTFVTNGPMLQLQVKDAEVGDLLTLKAAGRVRVRARVTFDPSRDKIDQVLLVKNGVSSPLKMSQTAPGVLTSDSPLDVRGSMWLALKAVGTKVGEAALKPQSYSELEYDVGATFGAGASMKEREKFAARQHVRPSVAHTATIWVELAGATPVSRQPASQVLARAWLQRLDALEAKLEDEKIGEVPLELGGLPNSDSVDLKDLLANRGELRRLIKEAKSYFLGLLDPDAPCSGVGCAPGGANEQGAPAKRK